MWRLVFFAVLCVGSFGFVARPTFPDQKIVGGVPTTIDQHPHQVSVRLYGFHQCGGSIISNNWVVTAGHCIATNFVEYFKVSVGSNHINGGVDYDVKRIVRHPQYNASAIDYDIALIELNRTLELTNFVNTINLPDVEIKTNQTVNVTGWGALGEGGSSSTQLREVTLSIVDHASCKEAYKARREITSRMICAGVPKGGKDACQGDSGGPLTVNKSLYGIVSWGYGCARPNYPGVFTNVAEVRPWIKSITGL